MNKKLLGLLLSLCMAVTQVTALTPLEKAGLFGSNVMKIGKDAFFAINTKQPDYVAPKRLAEDEDHRDENYSTDDYNADITPSLFIKLTTKNRINPSRTIDINSLANLMLSMTIPSITAKTIQGKYTPKALLKTAGFSATGALVNYLIRLTGSETQKLDFFIEHDNLNFGKNILVLLAAAISYVVAQNPELVASAIAEIKEKGFATASGEFCEESIKNFSENSSRADRIAFVVRNVLPLILMRKNISATYLSTWILPTQDAD